MRSTRQYALVMIGMVVLSSRASSQSIERSRFADGDAHPDISLVSGGKLTYSTARLTPDSLSAPLILLDDFGVPITESDLRPKMRRRWNWAMQSFVALAGSITAYLIVPKGPNFDKGCSVYDPCSDREEFHGSWSPIAGAVVSALVYNAARPPVDRIHAVEMVREDRRRSHRSTSKPTGSRGASTQQAGAEEK